MSHKNCLRNARSKTIRYDSDICNYKKIRQNSCKQSSSSTDSNICKNIGRPSADMSADNHAADKRRAWLQGFKAQSTGCTYVAGCNRNT